VARAEAAQAGHEDIVEILLRLERELFVLNAELATAPSDVQRLTPGTSLVTAEMTTSLEAMIDDLTGRFEQPQDFVVPGNSRLGAQLDLAARVVRRAERAIGALAGAEDVRSEARRYVNRLADLVWVLARYAEREHHQPRPRSD
jgi:cob(I)alamin adenosyltransferase